MTNFEKYAINLLKNIKLCATKFFPAVIKNIRTIKNTKTTLTFADKMSPRNRTKS